MKTCYTTGFIFAIFVVNPWKNCIFVRFINNQSIKLIKN